MQLNALNVKNGLFIYFLYWHIRFLRNAYIAHILGFYAMSVLQNNT